MPPLSEIERNALLRLARRSIEEAVRSNRPLEMIPRDGIFGVPQGVFVTLHLAGELRGCIGVIEPAEPLGESLSHCAVSAAAEDPRFPPVRAEELGDLKIEISLLTKPQPIRAEDVQIGRHGLLITRGHHCGLLLPQVGTEHQFSRERFLEETCHKAGLLRTSWSDPETQIHAFTCEVFAEGESPSRSA